MKRVFPHPPIAESGKKYWRSLEELSGSAEFRGWLEKEFPAGAAEMEMDGVSRRNFLQLMGASIALAGFGLSGCRRPEAYLTPFSKSVEWSIPGKALFYASAMPSRKGAIPLVVTSYDGRPVKIEGNPLLPGSLGSTDAFAQASILDLYDPDRSRRFRDPEGNPSDLAAFQAWLDGARAEWKSNSGAGLAFVLEENNSPTRARLRTLVAKEFPAARWCVYEPLGNENGASAARVAFGPGISVRRDLEKADVVVSLGCDFLGSEEGTLEDARGFAARRRLKSAEDSMSRLYVVEHRYTLTGGMADHRYRLEASRIPGFTMLLAKAVAEVTGDGPLGAMVRTLPQAESGFDLQWIGEAAKDLTHARGKSLVTPGYSQPVSVHLLAFAMNEALGNVGNTLLPGEGPNEKNISIVDLSNAVKAGQIQALVVCGGNPSYNAPADLGWAGLQKSVPASIRLGYREDETSAGSKWHLPAAHYLESWGDALAPDGTYLPVQPMILPLFGGLSDVDLLAMIAGLPRGEGPEHVRETFRGIAKPSDFDSAWAAWLRDGFLPESIAPVVVRPFDAAAAHRALAEAAPTEPLLEGYEIVFAGDSKIDDGRHINNGWLQELPDPITRLTWDNAAWVSPATAKTLGVQMHEMAADTVRIEANGASVVLPVLVCPGHADGSITVTLGYGQEHAGQVGRGTGVNVYPLRTSAALFVAKASVKATGERMALATTHGHWTMEGRELFREAPLEHYRAKPDFATTMGMDGHSPPDINLFRAAPLDAPEQWGMSVDLATCTGCNACVVACQSENNIPIVGKEQVINQREMHWIRIDRYFASVDDHEPNPTLAVQPVACMHCENAPCETVCPVNATVHSEDGLNVMVYNRCIGTRYCANNCPFKVRRFNFFDYNKRRTGKTKIGPVETGNLYLGPLGGKQETALSRMSKNPNVTVRMRGVMEKCTFCVQRIEEAKIKTRVEAGASDRLKIPTDSIRTACQQACPTGAIVFGDLSDPESRVVQLKAMDRDYVMLKYLNIRPRLSYLARVRNPNPAVPGAELVGFINGAPHDSHGAAHEPAAKPDAHH